jgi:hypothetical protein
MQLVMLPLLILCCLLFGIISAASVSGRLQAFSTNYPLMVLDTDTKHLSLDFDNIFSDETFPSKLFLPAAESIYNPLSWQVPLKEATNAGSLMNLESKMKQVRVELASELIDSGATFSWISDSEAILSYITVVSVSISQLGYLVSRMEATSNFDSETREFIFGCVRDHLQAVYDFTSHLLAYSGPVGLLFESGKVFSPEKYIEVLLALRSKEASTGMCDEMFATFIEFFFEAFWAEYENVLTKAFLDYVRYDRWFPLPIKYSLNHRTKEYNLGLWTSLVEFSCLKAFSVDDADSSLVLNRFDSRNLVELGRLLQHSLIHMSFLKDAMASMKTHGLTVHFQFDESLVRFLELAFSHPSLLPSDPETAALMGSLALPFMPLVDLLSERETVAMIKEIWVFFTGPADFSGISDSAYANLCGLVQRMDFMFPGISDFLWENVRGTHAERSKSQDLYNSFKASMETFNKDIAGPQNQFDFLTRNFPVNGLYGNGLLDSKTCFLLFDFHTDVVVDALEAFQDETDDESLASYAKIIENSIDSIDWILRKFAHKSVLAHWYNEFDFIPTRIFDAINELWMLSRFRPFLVDCVIWEDLHKLVDNHPVYARHFMHILISKTKKHAEPALSAKMAFPMCLHHDRLLYDYFEAILDCNGTSLSDYFFSGLSASFCTGEVSLATVEQLLLDLKTRKDLLFDTCSPDFSSFFSPAFIIEIEKAAKSGQMGEAEAARVSNIFRLYMENIYLKQVKISITCGLLRSLSAFIGMVPFISGKVVDAKDEATEVDSVFLDSLTMSRGTDGLFDFSSVSLHFVMLFYLLFTKGLSKVRIEIVFLKLVDLVRSLDPREHEGSAGFVEFVYSFNCVLLLVMRSKDFVMPREGVSSMALYDFFRGCHEFVPNPVENLVQSLRQQLSLVAIYNRIIERQGVLPSGAFSLAAFKDLKAMHVIQNNFMKLIVSSGADFIDSTRMKIVLEWIKNGTIKPEHFIKFLQGLEPTMTADVVILFVPLIYEFCVSEAVPERTKLLALKTAFSVENDEIVRKLCSCRSNLLVQSFLEIFTLPAGVAFLQQCKDAVWYVALKAESQLVQDRKLSHALPERNTINFNAEANHFRTELIYCFRTPVRDSPRNRDFITNADDFIQSVSQLRFSGPLKDYESIRMALLYIVSLNWELATCEDSFFKMFLETESHVALLKTLPVLFENDHRMNGIFIVLLESITLPEIRLAVLDILPSIINEKSLVLSYSSLKLIHSWFNGRSLRHLQFKDFVRRIVKAAFNCVRKASEPSSTTSPVLKELFCALNRLYTNKSPAVAGFDELVFDELVDDFNFPDIIGKSSEFMQFCRSIVENMDTANGPLLMKMISVLRCHSNLYLINPISWEIVWKKLADFVPQVFFAGSELNVFLRLGNFIFVRWRSLIPIAIQIESLSSKIRMKTYLELIKKRSPKDRDVIALQLIPEKLYRRDFDSFQEIYRVFTSFEEFLVVLESDGDVAIDLNISVLKKLLVLMEFEVQMGGNLVWSWHRIFQLLGRNHLLLLEFELVRELVDYLLPSPENHSRDFLKKTLRSQKDTLNFIFKLSKYALPGEDDINACMALAVSIYNEQSASESVLLNDSQQELCAFVNKSVRKHVKDMRVKEMMASISDLDGFAELVGDEIPPTRQDELAVASFNYIFSMVANFERFLKDVSDEFKPVFSDLVVRVIGACLRSGNVLGMAKSLSMVSLESFIVTIGDNLTETSVSEFVYIVEELLKIAELDVLDLMFQQISDSAVRLDVCLMTREIVKNVVKGGREFTGITFSEWPIFYLQLLADADVPEIHSDHFRMIGFMLEAIKFKNIPFISVFDHLGLILKNTNLRICPLGHVFAFVEEMFAKFLSISDDVLYQAMLNDSVMKRIVEVAVSDKAGSKAVVIGFFKNLKRRNTEKYDMWLESSGSKNPLNLLLQADSDSKMTSLHTALSERMIEALQEGSLNSLVDLLFKYRNVSVKFVEADTLRRLVCALVQFMKEVDCEDGLKDGVKFVFSCVNCFYDEVFEDLVSIANRIFDDELFELMVASISASGNASSGLERLLEGLGNRVQLNNLKSIRGTLRQFNLFDDADLLDRAAFISDPLQALEYFQNVKGIESARKLSLINACAVPIGNNEGMVKLISYVRSGLMAQKDAIQREVWLRFVLENDSLNSVFTASPSKTNSKHKASLLTLLKANLSARKVREIEGSIGSWIGRTVLNVYFKPSNLLDSDIFSGPIDSEWAERLLFAFSADLINGEDQVLTVSGFVKCFRMLHELDEVGWRVRDDRQKVQLMNSLIDGLYAFLIRKPVLSFATGPLVIDSVFRVLRRCSGKRLEKKLIMHRLLRGSGSEYRADCLRAFLRVQADLGKEIDKEFFDEVKKRLRGNSQLTALMVEFEGEYLK